MTTHDPEKPVMTLVRPEAAEPAQKSAPRGRSQPRKNRQAGRFQFVPVRFLIPNIITLLALVSGVTAIRLGIEGRFELAVAAVVLACLLDAADGRVAHFLKGNSRFGAELDSLADVVNFGVTPGVLIFLWSLKQLGGLGWIVVLGFVMCMALRLARFNVALSEADKPAWADEFFVGVPAPAGAVLAMFPMYLGFLGLVPPGPETTAVTAFWIVLISAGVISRLPTLSNKKWRFRIHRHAVAPSIAAAGFFIAALISYPWSVLSLASGAYIAAIPVAVWRYRKKKAAQRTASSDREAAPDKS